MGAVASSYIYLRFPNCLVRDSRVSTDATLDRAKSRSSGKWAKAALWKKNQTTLKLKKEKTQKGFHAAHAVACSNVDAFYQMFSSKQSIKLSVFCLVLCSIPGATMHKVQRSSDSQGTFGCSLAESDKQTSPCRSGMAASHRAGL